MTTTHHYVMFFTNTGRVYRLKAYEIPGSRKNGERYGDREPSAADAGRADHISYSDQQV